MSIEHLKRTIAMFVMIPVLVALNVGCGGKDEDDTGGSQPTNSAAGGGVTNDAGGGGVTDETADGIGGGGDADCGLVKPAPFLPAWNSTNYISTSPWIFLQWTAVPGATGYFYCVNYIPEGAPAVYAYSSGCTTDPWTQFYASDYGRYYYSVRAYGPEGCKYSSSMYWYFNVLPTSELPCELAKPSLVSPESESTLYLSTYPWVNLEWTSVPRATSYAVDVTRIAPDGTTTWGYFTATTTDPWCQFSTTEGGRYYYSVRAYGPEGCASSHGDYWYFNVTVP